MDKNTKKVIAQIKRHRTVKIAQVARKAFSQHRKGDKVGMSKTIVDEFVMLGGVYVKFLQGVLLQSKLLKNSTSTNKLRIFENLDYETIDLPRYLEAELGTVRLSNLATINPVPFAAGSFGQVYYATHRDGTPVVLKVLRPMVRETLRYDLRLLGVFMKRFVERNYKNIDVSLKQALDDFKIATLRETDYVEEARFANELYEHYKNHDKFIIPKTYLELCTPNVIVQEYIGGISGAELVKMKAQGVKPSDYIKDMLGSDLEQQLTTIGYEYLYGVFTLERIQGDPHPGNIRFLADNKVGLIDFGISAKTPEEKVVFLDLCREYEKLFRGQQDVASLFNQFLRFFVTDLYRALKKLNAVIPKKQDDEDFTKLIGKIAQQTFESDEFGVNMPITELLKGDNSSQTFMAINKLVNKDNRFGLVVRLESSELLRAAQTFFTLVSTLEFQTSVLPEVFTRVIKTVEADMPDVATASDDAMGISDALEVISNWLERIAERDPKLFQQLLAKIRSQEVMDVMQSSGVQ